jgi:signal transduction histidine kinase/HAMP domain-containing protein
MIVGHREDIMFANWSLRRRIVTLVLVAATIIISAITAMTLVTASTVVENQAWAALTARGNDIAHQLDTELQAVRAAAEALAASLPTSQESPVNSLWQAATTLMSADGSLISRVGVMHHARDGYQIVLFAAPPVPGNVAPLSNILTETLPEPLAFLESVTAEDVGRWYGPGRAYRATQPVIKVVVPFIGTDNRLAGVVWAEIPLHALENLLGSIEYTESEAQSVSVIWLGDDGALTATYNIMSRERPTLDDPENQAILAQIQAGDLDSFIMSNNPLESGSAYVVVTQMPINHWRLVRIVPFELIYAQFNQNSLAAVAVIIVGLIALAWVVDRYAERRLTLPLANLTLAAQEIGSGDMRYQITTRRRDDELGRLAGSLEVMRTNLAHSYDQLAMWSRTLEQRVQERTAQLEEARKQSQATAAELRAVYDTSLAMVNEYYLDIVLQKLTEQVPRLLKATYCAIWLLDGDETQLRLVATTAGHRDQIGRVASASEGLAGAAIRKRAPVIIDNYFDWTGKPTLRSSDIRRVVAAPLIFSNAAIGAVVAARPTDSPAFTDNDQRLLTLLANLIAPVVRNAQLFEQLDQAVKRAQSANEVKTRFLASVTHELRTPLNLVINNMDFMRVGVFGPVNDEQRERLEQTIRSAEHLLYLINDLLDVSKIEAGEMRLFTQPTELYPVLEDALDATVALMGENSPIVLEADIPENLPIIEMDARRIRQVLLNLLSNAVKFTREGEVRLSVEVLPDCVEFAVRDTGIGIAEEDQARIFEPFERTRPALQMAIEGTGLGLSISRYLVEAHGGKLWLKSEEGKGSTFKFMLPISQPTKARPPQGVNSAAQ